MEHYHTLTEHTYASVRAGTSFFNWNSQPSLFKIYPQFYLKQDISKYEHLEFLSRAACLTYKKEYANSTHLLRSYPSAGALYPNEIYVQLRGVKGFDDGIYHLEIISNKLSFLAPLQRGGVESYFRDKREIRGAVVLVSGAYFRSTWKYKNRSFRYVLLDCGHILGSFESSFLSLNKEVKFEFDFDKEGLNRVFNFENKEFMLSALIYGERGEREISGSFETLSFVNPTDYFNKSSVVENIYKESLEDKFTQNKNQSFIKSSFEPERLKKAILNRRSIRAFTKEEISFEEFEAILEFLCEPINSEHTEKIEIFYAVHRVSGLKSGLYKNRELLKEGDFKDRCRYLCLEQNLGGDSAATFFITGKFLNYQLALILSGIFGHRLYIASQYHAIGASGIGAYYDKEVKEFLESSNHIYYALALGR